MHSFPVEVELAADVAKREITAYAAVFGNRDAQGMRIQQGAFLKTLGERLAQGQIKLFRNHEEHIGVVRHAEEDGFGLLTVGYVSKTRAGDDALEQVRDGSLSRYSFRARIIRASVSIDGEDADGFPIETLELKELLLREVGPVNLDPANPLAAILAVKNLDSAALDSLSEMPYLVKSLTLSRGRSNATADERHVVRCLLRLHEEIGGNLGVLKALLAPDSGTSAARPTPPPSTPAGALEAAQLAELQKLIAGLAVG